MCLESMVKKFKLLLLIWGGVGYLPFWNPQILSNFTFPLYLFTLNISYDQLKRLKNLIFGEPHLKRNPILVPLIFVRFSLFLISTHADNFHPSSCNGLKI